MIFDFKIKKINLGNPDAVMLKFGNKHNCLCYDVKTLLKGGLK